MQPKSGLSIIDVSRRGVEDAVLSNRNPPCPLRLCVILLFLALVPGCNRPSFNLAPVHGKVTVDNKPLTKGKVMFAPIAPAGVENPGKPAVGNIETSGNYWLTTFSKNDGAVVGEHWVTIINTSEEV